MPPLDPLIAWNKCHLIALRLKHIAESLQVIVEYDQAGDLSGCGGEWSILNVQIMTDRRLLHLLQSVPAFQILEIHRIVVSHIATLPGVAEFRMLRVVKG